jgi:K+-sensing histidine kinase KdpD
MSWSSSPHRPPRSFAARAGGWLLACLVPAAVAGVLVPLRDHIRNTNLALLLVLVVLGAAVVGGRAAGVLAALSSALAYDFALTRPYWSLLIARSDDLETTMLLAVIGVVAGHLVHEARRHEALALARRRDVERLRRRAELAAGGERPGRLIGLSLDPPLDVT